MRQDTEKKDAADQELNLEIQKANYFATAARENWISIVSFLIFLVVWELICRFDLIGPYQLVPPSEVITVFFEKLTDANPDGTVLQQHAVASLALALAGFLAAVVIGVPLGLFMGWYPKVNLLVRPLFDAIRPIPPIAWIPIAILWLGIGMTAKAFIIFLAAFVPCVINSYTGIRLKDLYEIRLIFEPQAAYYAAQRATDEELAQILEYGQILREKLLNGEDCVEINRLFHNSIALSTHNEFMVRLVPIINSEIVRLFSETNIKQVVHRHTLSDHDMILNYMEFREAQGARVAMELHILHSMQDYDF